MADELSGQVPLPLLPGSAVGYLEQDVHFSCLLLLEFKEVLAKFHLHSLPNIPRYWIYLARPRSCCAVNTTWSLCLPARRVSHECHGWVSGQFIAIIPFSGTNFPSFPALCMDVPSSRQWSVMRLRMSQEFGENFPAYTGMEERDNWPAGPFFFSARLSPPPFGMFCHSQSSEGNWLQPTKPLMPRCPFLNKLSQIA